jgi:NitT/TauT family transport system permease protein
MVILAAVALTTEVLVTALENRLIRWRPTPAGEVTI